MANELANIFDSDAFTMVSMTESINKMPYKPARVGQMGLFNSKGITTAKAAVELRGRTLALLETKRRGEPGDQHKEQKRVVKLFEVPHIPYDDRITAESLLGVRAFGSTDRLAGVAQVVNDHLEDMRASHEVTLEHMRMGAIHGTVWDADGSTLEDLFDAFGISQEVVDFVLGTSTTNIKGKVLGILRHVEENLGAQTYDHVHALCSSGFFDAFINHDEVKAAYDRWRDGEFLRSDPRKGFPYCGVIWEEYRGKVGSRDFITAGDARFFPVGAPGLFAQANAPADFIETVNTPGQPVYAKQAVDAKFQRYVDIHTQSNPFPFCTRPAVLVRGHSSD
jgi:hypothetical protein